MMWTCGQWPHHLSRGQLRGFPPKSKVGADMAYPFLKYTELCFNMFLVPMVLHLLCLAPKGHPLGPCHTLLYICVCACIRVCVHGVSEYMNIRGYPQESIFSFHHDFQGSSSGRQASVPLPAELSAHISLPLQLIF